MHTEQKQLSTGKKLLVFTMAIAMNLPLQQVFAAEITPHFTKHSDLLEPAYEIEGFSFMPGAAVIDVDKDGYEDLYLVNGKGFPNTLYKNQRGKGFKKVTTAHGLSDIGASTGVAVGDLNNDGFDDIYVGNATTIADGIDSDDGSHLFIKW